MRRIIRRSITRELKRIVLAWGVVILLGLTMGVTLGAAEPLPAKADWNNLKQLDVGQEIRVVLNDAKSYQGRFQSVSDEAIIIRLEAAERTFSREQVLRVSAKREGRRLRNAAVGGAIGVAAAVLVGVARCAEVHYRLPCYGGAALFIGGIGAGVGAVIPTGGWKEVYRAR